MFAFKKHQQPDLELHSIPSSVISYSTGGLPLAECQRLEMDGSAGKGARGNDRAEELPAATDIRSPQRRLVSAASPADTRHAAAGGTQNGVRRRPIEPLDVSGSERKRGTSGERACVGSIKLLFSGMSSVSLLKTGLIPQDLGFWYPGRIMLLLCPLSPPPPPPPPAPRLVERMAYHTIGPFLYSFTYKVEGSPYLLKQRCNHCSVPRTWVQKVFSAGHACVAPRANTC